MEKVNISPDQINRFMGMLQRESETELAEFVFLEDINIVFNYRSYINSMIERLKTQIKSIDFAVETFSLMEIGFDEEDVKESKIELDVSISQYSDYLNRVNELIEHRQNHCQHKWEVVGNTSHRNLERCKKCGKEDWV
jgi:FtsZ-binding cell division protein ZapB